MDVATLRAECDQAAAKTWPDKASSVTEQKDRRQVVAPAVVASLIRRRSGSPAATFKLIADLIEAGVIPININGGR